MIPPNKKGRPPSKATIEKRRIEDMFRNLPPHLKSLSKEEFAILKKSFEQSDAIQKEILADYKHGKTTPDSHAYSMASLGDESMIGYDKKILSDDAFYAQRANQYRAKGTAATKKKNSIRKAAIKNINQHLIAKIQADSAFTHHHVAQLIFEQWTAVSLGQKVIGEQLIKCRGDGGTRPSLSTISRWIKP